MKLVDFYERHSPPGMELHHEAAFFGTGMLISILFSLSFFAQYWNARQELYQNRRLIPGEQIAPFGEIADPTLAFFLVLGLCLPAFILFRWFYFYQGSKSIYLMKRLPQKHEISRRILLIPCLEILLCTVTAMLLRLLYFVVYLTATPSQCLPDMVWQQLWRVLQ